MKSSLYTIDLIQLETLLKNNEQLTKQADMSSFIDGFTDSLFSTQPIAKDDLQPINDINPLNHQVPKKKKKEDDDAQNVEDDIKNLGKQNVDTELNLTDISIEQEDLQRANSVLSRYTYPQPLEQLLQYTIALQLKYPKLTLSNEIPTYINRTCFEKWSRSYNIFIDPNDDSPRNISFLKQLKNGTIRNCVPADADYFPEDQSIADQMCELMEINCDDDPAFDKCMIEAIKLQTELNIDINEAQQRKNQQQLDRQDRVEENRLHSNFFNKRTETTSPRQSTTSNNSIDWDINLLLSTSAQLTSDDQLKKHQQEKLLKYHALPEHTSKEEAILNNNARNETLEYIQKFIKKINYVINNCAPPRDTFIVTPQQKEELIKLRQQLRELINSKLRGYHDYKYYYSILNPLFDKYGASYSMLDFPHKKKVEKQEAEKGRVRSRRKTKFTDEYRAIQQTKYKDLEINPLINPKYKKIENYMLYDADTGSTIPSEDGGIFERNNRWLEEYKAYIEGNSDKFKSNILLLAEKIFREIYQILDRRQELIKALPPITKQQVADCLQTWYHNNITLNLDKYYLMLKRACRQAFIKFYKEHADEEKYMV